MEMGGEQGEGRGALSGGQQRVPRPSLSLHPSQGVSLGDNVTLRCHLPQPVAWVRLCQEERFLSCESVGDNGWPWSMPTRLCLIADPSLTNVTIQCRNKDNGTSLLLHKDGCSAPVQRQDPDGAGTASFLLFGVTLADSGTYRCSSRSRNFPFVSSPLGDSVTLEVT
uniref:Ig-like domain-containing protein n=1 Tax=Phasianus colchicus TaxID=9054 RepID=A0A669R4V5_PHACC